MATIAQVTTIDTATTGTLTVATITDTAANIAASTNDVIANSMGAVSASDTATTAQADTISALATAVVYSVSGTAAEIVAASSAARNEAVNITITDDATIAQATTAEDATNSGTVTVATITDTAANITASTNAVITNSTGAVTASDKATTAQADTIVAFGQAVVYNVSGTAAEIVAASSAARNEAVNITITDDATIAQATTAEDATNSGTVTVATITDTAANITASTNAVITNSTGAVTASDTATVAQATTIDALAKAVVFAVSDTAAAIAASTSDALDEATSVTVSNATTIAQLTTIDALYDGIITYTSITDTATNLATNTGGYVTGSVDVTITGSVNVAKLKAINAETSGNITLNVTNDSLFGTAVDLAAAFVGTVTTHTGTVIITDEPTSAQLKTINDATNGAITLSDVDGALSGTASDLIDGLNGITSHEGTVNITTSASTSQLTSIDTATIGVITVQTTTIGANAGYDLTLDLATNGTTDLSNFTGLTTIDASGAGNAAMTVTAADIFAANDSTGNIAFAFTGTNGGGDTLDFSTGVENWSTADSGATYTATGNFDGIAGDETYTITTTDLSVTI